MGTGLVPEFAGYPSSMTVESEWMVVVVVREEMTRLSDDKDTVDASMGNEHEGPKRWCWGGERGCRRCQTPVVGGVEGVGGRTISSVDETSWRVVVGFAESRWRCLAMVDGGGGQERRWTRDGGAVGCSRESQETLMTLNFLKVIRNSSLKLLFLNF